MIKQILAIHRDMWIIRKGCMKSIRQILEVYRYIRILRKKGCKND